MSRDVRYVGELDAVRLATGEKRRARGHLGIIQGVGLVTAPTVRALLDGRFATQDVPQWERLTHVYYHADRRHLGHPNPYWVHDLANTDASRNGRVTIFRHRRNGAPYICKFPTGNFICEG
jgi:hypothetical protein